VSSTAARAATAADRGAAATTRAPRPSPEKVKLNAERATYWLSVGAQPSETVNSFFRKLGVHASRQPSRPQRDSRRREGPKGA
jgi:ribosomal protein S16